MPHLKVYCFDPGATTGFTALLVRPEVGEISILDTREFENWEGLELILPRIEPSFDPLMQSTIVCEHLTSQHPSFRQIGIEVMGAIEYLCHVHVLKLVLQSPSMMDAARRLHPMKKIKSDHIRDAIHHGIAYAYREFNCKFNIRTEGDQDNGEEE